MPRKKADYAYGHKADPNELGVCKVCGQLLRFIAQTNQPDQWRHPKRWARGPKNVVADSYMGGAWEAD